LLFWENLVLTILRVLEEELVPKWNKFEVKSGRYISGWLFRPEFAVKRPGVLPMS
jgi:hypothetical protein